MAEILSNADPQPIVFGEVEIPTELQQELQSIGVEEDDIQELYRTFTGITGNDETATTLLEQLTLMKEEDVEKVTGTLTSLGPKQKQEMDESSLLDLFRSHAPDTRPDFTPGANINGYNPRLE